MFLIRYISIITILILLSPSFIVNYSIPIMPKEAEALEPVTTRYACHQEKDYQNGTHQLTSGLPCWVKGSPYTKWVLTSYTDRIEMKNGLYGSMLNTSDSTNRFYDLYYHDLKSTENWIVQYWNGNAWVDSGISSVAPTISTLQNDTGIFVRSTRENSEIELVIDYITLEGLPLKHSIELKNLGSEKEFRIIQSHQVIEGYYFDSGLGRTLLESSVTVTGNVIEFQYTNTTHIITEMQHSYYYRNATLTKTDYGIKADFLFGNAVNQTSLLLGQNGSYRLESGETCSNTDQKCNKKGYGARWLASCSSAGDGCTIDQASSQRASQVSGTGAGQTWDLDDVGKEDGNRAYLWLTVFDVANVTAGAEITDVTIGMGSDFKVNGAGASAINLDMHVVDNDSCSGIASLSANAGFSDDALGVSILTAPVVASNFNAGVQSTHVNLNDHANRYISQRTASSANSTDDHIACIAFSQAGTDVGGTSSQRYHYNMDGPHMNITVTYSSTIDMAIDVKDINGHLITHGNLKVRSEQGGTTTYTTCSNECTLEVEPDSDVTFAVQWNPNTNANNYVKIDVGANSSMVNTHTKQCSSNCDVNIFTTIYRNIQIEYRDESDQLHSPSGVTYLFTENSTEVTDTSFDSKGVNIFPMLSKGNSSAFRIKDVSMYGNNVVTNGSVTVTPTVSDDVFEHNNRVYLIDIVVADKSSTRTITPSRLDFKFSCSTVCSNTTEVALTDFTNVMITNMTVDLMSMRYQGWSLNQNSTDFSIGKMPASNKTILLRANYFKSFFQAQADSSNVPVSVTLHSALNNGTTIDVVSGTTGINAEAIYVGNGTNTYNIIWQSLNVSQTDIALTDSVTTNIATQLKVQEDTIVIGKNNSMLSEFAWHESNSTLRANVSISPNNLADDQTLKIEIVDRQYANSPTKRILNATESESGWTFADPITTDASFTIGGTKDTLLKYVFNPESDFQNPGLGGGGGGSSRRRVTTESAVDLVLPPSTPEEPAFEESLLIGLVLVGVVGVAFFTGGGTPNGTKRKSSVGKRSSRSKRGFS